MRFEILDTNRGDVLAVFSSQDEAAASLATYLCDHADQIDDLALATVDGSGDAARLTSGANLLGDSRGAAG